MSYNRLRLSMLTRLLKLLIAGTVGFASIIGAGLVLALHDRWLLPVGTSNTRLIAVMLMPIPIGLSIAWAVYRLLDLIIGPESGQPR